MRVDPGAWCQRGQSLAVGPDAQLQHDLPVRGQVHPILGDRGTQHVATEPLEAVRLPLAPGTPGVHGFRAIRQRGTQQTSVPCRRDARDDASTRDFAQDVCVFGAIVVDTSLFADTARFSHETIEGETVLFDSQLGHLFLLTGLGPWLWQRMALGGPRLHRAVRRSRPVRR